MGEWVYQSGWYPLHAHPGMCLQESCVWWVRLGYTCWRSPCLTAKFMKHLEKEEEEEEVSQTFLRGLPNSI